MEEIEELFFEDDHFSWSAPEFINHEKPTSWYLWFGGFTLVASLIVIFVIGDIWSLVLLLSMALAVVVFAAKPPRVLSYTITDEYLSINDRKTNSFNEFVSYSLISEAGYLGAILNPAKRFAPPMIIYFTNSEEPSIMPFLQNNFILQAYSPSIFDNVINKIRF